MSQQGDTPIVILAAGASTRLGRSKQLLPFGDVSLLAHMILRAQEVSSKVVVVLGARYPEHHTAIASFHVEIINNTRWETGMGSSIKAGVDAARRLWSPEQIIVMACDQPHLTASHLTALLKAASETHHSIVASAYDTTVGIPALFKSSAFELLATLPDESGAGRLLRSGETPLSTIYFSGGGFDIDTPEDLKKFEGL